MLGSCNEHQTWCQPEIKVSRLSYLLNKWFFWKNNGTIVISVFKIDIAKCFYFSKNVICSKDMRDVTLWFHVFIMADAHYVNPTLWLNEQENFIGQSSCPQCWVYVMSISHDVNLKSKCHISHIYWTNYIFGKIKTLCYINFKNWYDNCTIIFPKKSFVQEIWEAWHFDFRLTSWLMTLKSVVAQKVTVGYFFLLYFCNLHTSEVWKMLLNPCKNFFAIL